MNHIGITAVSITFWVFLTVVALAGILQEYRKRKLALGLLRAAIEHGQQLSPELLAKLLGREEEHEELDPKLLQVGGIVTCASGVGVALLSIFIALVYPPYHWIALGVGVVAMCVGLGLMIAAKSLRR